jgi:hypothetical protein
MRILISFIIASIFLTFLIFAAADFGSKFITLSPEQKAQADNWMRAQTYDWYRSNRP